jgi:hypothetical protein
MGQRLLGAGKVPVAYVDSAPDHVQFGFFRGSAPKDPSDALHLPRCRQLPGPQLQRSEGACISERRGSTACARSRIDGGTERAA